MNRKMKVKGEIEAADGGREETGSKGEEGRKYGRKKNKKNKRTSKLS